ncbi:MAG: zonular occludens toxin domain-containing protein [Candidatus Competibacter sp.]|nr:zonular occludens toxin domain-containing protein [Candidatus Competibacter sp.]
MIIFHEGLPGSGKTYEAVVKHLLPTLQTGRKVFAYIEGLDHQKISDLIGRDVAIVRELLVVIDRDEVLNVHLVVSDNAFLIIDEAQNFYPLGKLAQEKEMTRFVSEHRHRGIDILLMGQDLRDVHPLFRRRVDQRVNFTKMDMMGLSTKYRWVLQKAMSGERFQEINRGMSEYEKKYFGVYKSHVHGDVNTEMYQDKRANIWRSNYFVFGIILVVIMFIYGYYGYSKFFTSHHDSKYEARKETLSQSVSSSVVPVPVQVQQVKPDEYDLIDDYIKRGYRPRLAAVFLASQKTGVNVEFRDSSLRVQDRLDASVVLTLGWKIKVYGLDLVVMEKKGYRNVYLTPWPLDSTGRVSQENLNEIRERSDERQDRKGT